MAPLFLFLAIALAAGSSSRVVPSPSTTYMLDLYQRLAQGPTRGLADTVRSVPGVLGRLNGVPAVIFNASSGGGRERLWTAELHLLPRKNVPESSSLHLWALGSDEDDNVPRPLGTLVLPGRDSDVEEGRGWKTIDASQVLGTSPPSSVFLTAQGDVPLSRLLRYNALPFFVLFLDAELDNHSRIVHAAAVLSEEASRSKRDVADNDLPGENNVVSRLTSSPSPVRLMTNRVRGPRVRGRGRSRVRQDEDTLPFPSHWLKQNSHRGRGRGRGRRRWGGRARSRDGEGKKRTRGNRRHQQEWEVNEFRADTKSRCHRRALEVSFAAVGWDFIIAPPLLHTHYCAGACPPKLQAMPSTNHALLMSLVRAQGGLNEVSSTSSCCIPSSFEDVSILYMDEGDRVELKTFRDMAVRTCACR